jgi:hypothetical protein
MSIFVFVLNFPFTEHWFDLVQVLLAYTLLGEVVSVFSSVYNRPAAVPILQLQSRAVWATLNGETKSSLLLLPC